MSHGCVHEHVLHTLRDCVHEYVLVHLRVHAHDCDYDLRDHAPHGRDHGDHAPHGRDHGDHALHGHDDGHALHIPDVHQNHMP